MATILKVFTGDQLYTMWRDYLISKNVGLTDFNDGSKTKALIQACADITSAVSMDLKESLFQAIPEALYVGFGFPLKAATGATGYLRPYRNPAFTIKYTGSGTVAALTISSTQISTVVTGAGADNFTLLFSTYATTDLLVAKINTLANWSATVVKTAVQCSTLYQYTGVNILGQTTYRTAVGMDIMLATAIAVTISAGYSASVNSLQFLTLTSNTILAGTSGIQCTAQCTTTGTIGDISAAAIDSANGKGSMNSVIAGVDAVINDTAFSGGADQETAAARQTRFVNTVNALNAGTASGITVALEGISTVRSVDFLENYPYRGMNTVLVDDGTGTIGAPLLAELNLVLYGDPANLTQYPGKNTAGMGYNFLPPTIQSVSVGVTVSYLATSNVDPTVIKNDVVTAIEQYINTLTIGSDVILSEIVRVAKNSSASIYDIVVNSSAANVTVNSTYVGRTGAGTGGTVTATMVATNGG